MLGGETKEVFCSFPTRSGIAGAALPNHLPGAAQDNPAGFRAPPVRAAAGGARGQRLCGDWSSPGRAGLTSGSLHLPDAQQGQGQCCSKGMEQLELGFASLHKRRAL